MMTVTHNGEHLRSPLYLLWSKSGKPDCHEWWTESDECHLSTPILPF